MTLTISDYIALATLATFVIGLYKVFQEARASKAVADLANSNAEIAAANAEIAAAHARIAATQAQEANVGIGKVAGSVAEIVTNTNGMQRRMEELARADERHITEDRDAGRPAG